MSNITTHILDTSIGRPAAGVLVVLSRGDHEIGRGHTDGDGRLKTLLGDQTLATGLYRLTFHVGPYFTARNVESFYPEVAVSFHIKDAAQHYHVPLLLNPFGYSTYRGS